MQPPEQNIETLSDFGLTTNQARVYMAVARLGLTTVGQISKTSKVRREDVYRVLPKLETMGLVEKLLGTPVKIRATPLEEALSILIEQEQDVANEKISGLKTKKEEFLKRFKAYESKPKLESEAVNFSLLSQRDQIIGKALNMLKTTEREFDFVCSRNKLMQFIHTFDDQLRKITRTGVKVRIVSGLPEYEDTIPRIMEEQIAPKTSIELKYTDLQSSHYIIADFLQALIATTTEGNMAENPCLWTDNKNLVEVLQANFEALWHNAIAWREVETSAVPEKVVRFAEQLRPTNHVIFVYDSAEAKHQVLFNYIKVGLNNDEATVYVASDETPRQIQEAMKDFGIDMEKYEKTGALQVLNYEDIYITDGKFSLTTTMNLWNRLYNEALKKGFSGLRVTGEMACFFKHNLVKELLEYEKALHRILDTPMIAICAYNTNMLNKATDSINLYTELVKAHGTVLFTGIDNKLGKIEIRKG